jgi:membrane-associated protease RseP (regulator of RpoE activity)
LEPARELPLAPPEVFWLPHAKFQDRRWLHLLLFLATIITTTFWGTVHYESFASDLGFRPVGASGIGLLIRGLWYSATILLILGCHELGHYFACRYYDVDASRPFFLPFPLVMTGTLGAFIRIREPIPSKRMLFDIGIAGPIAGFVVAVPALFLGLAMSRVVVIPPGTMGWELGEPLLFKLASWILWGKIADGYTLNLHPMAFAAWFGLFATALNLMPVGQLDGGHITYSVFGRRSSHITLVVIACALALTLFSTTWILWTALMVVMLFVFGRHHPRTIDEDIPLDPGRKLLALVALIMFVLCFMPVPASALKMLQ